MIVPVGHSLTLFFFLVATSIVGGADLLAQDLPTARHCRLSNWLNGDCRLARRYRCLARCRRWKPSRMDNLNLRAEW